MTARPPTDSDERPPTRPDVASVLRFAAELVAWIATPWALWPHSWVLAVVSLLVLIGLPTILATPGDKSQVLMAVPGYATIAMVLLELAAAVVSAWFVWPLPVAIAVWALAACSVVTELPRWRSLASAGRLS